MPYPHSGTLARNRRVVVTGAGIITSMGCGWEPNALGFREGRIALNEITLFDVSRQRTQRGGQLNLPDALPVTALSPNQIRRSDRATHMLIHAAAEALAQAGWDREADRYMDVALGTSAGAMPLGEAFFRQAQGSTQRRGQMSRVYHYQPQRQAAVLMDAFELQGPVSLVSNACASGANAIGHGKQLIQSGRADRVLAGGYDALTQMVFAGFDSLQALSTTEPRPFDANRDGLALGEGAALMMLESWESATARGATILAELAGYGMHNDLHHLTQPQPDGDAALASMNAACADSGLDKSQIGYINAHGTGTPLNDQAEANAISRWKGDSVSEVAASSTKGCIGHLLGGAGAVEAVISLMALREGWLPPSAGLREADAAVEFDLVREARDQDLEAVMTNSFGFGGTNASLIFKQPSS